MAVKLDFFLTDDCMSRANEGLLRAIKSEPHKGIRDAMVALQSHIEAAIEARRDSTSNTGGEV